MSFTSPREVRDQHIVPIITNNTEDYARKVNFDRAFPHNSDGNKPVIRYALESLWELIDKGKKNRSIKAGEIVNMVIGRYHPHGDNGVYEAIASSTKDYISLFDAPDIAPRAAAKTKAARYVDIAFTELGMEYMSSRNLSDETTSHNGYAMPIALKPRFPYQLMRTSFSIGVGFEGLELPWNPVEVIDAQIAMIKGRIEGRMLTTEELADIMIGPDLTKNLTLYMSKEALHSLIEKGIGSMTAVAKIEVQDRKIVIRDTPYREHSPLVKDSLVKKSVTYHSNKGKYDPKNRKMIRGLINISKTAEPAKCFSQKDDIKIECYLDGTVPAEKVVADIYRKTNLKRSYLMKYVQVVEKDGREVLSMVPIRSIIERTIDNNIEYFTDVHTRAIEKLRHDFMFNTAMEKATRPEHIDFVLLNMKSKNKEALLLAREGVDFTPEEVKIVVKTAAGRFSDRDQILRELELFESRLAVLMDKLKPENILKETLSYIEGRIRPLVAKYERRSKLVYSTLATATPQIRQQVTYNDVYVNIQGTTLFTSMQEIDQEDVKSCRLKENAYLIAMTANDFVRIPVDEITDEPTQAMSYIGEKVYSVFPVSPETERLLLFLNTNGSMKSMYSTTADSRVAVVASAPITEGNIMTFDLEDEEALNTHVLAMVTKQGYTKTIALDRFRPKERKAGYLRVTKLKPDDSLVWAQVVPKGFKGATLTINGSSFEVDELSWDARIETFGTKITGIDEVNEVEVRIGEFTFEV